MPKPKIGLADVQCSRLKFEPGDRIIVRVHHRIDRDQERKLRRTVEKWAGTDVEVLIVNTTQFDLEVIKRDRLLGSSLRAE